MFLNNIFSIFRKNWVLQCCLIFFLGQLSLSFLGIENKSVRIATTFLIYIIIIRNKVHFIKDKIIVALLMFSICCFFSLFFSNNKILCGYKLLELFITLFLIIGGINNFHIRKNLTIFHILLYYYIFQSLIALWGYFTDPTTIAIDTGYGAYVTFLQCNFPPLHANGLGSFCGYGALASMTLFLGEYRKKRHHILLIVYILFFISCVYTMYLCSSRTSMISFTIAFLFLFHYAIKPNMKILLLTIGISIGIVYADKIEYGIYSIIMKKQTEETLSRADSEIDMLTSGRLGMWEYVLDHPERCIFGQGYGTGFLDMWESGETEASNAHNSIIEILYSAGMFALFFWLQMWWLIYKRFIWLMKRKEMLPLDSLWYYLALAIFILAIIRSIGNLNFVYFKLDSFAPMAIIILFVYSTKYVKCQLKKNRKQSSPF